MTRKRQLMQETIAETTPDSTRAGALIGDPVQPVFVTGASGFVGRHALGAFQGRKVFGLVRSARSRLPEGVEPVVGDVADRESLRDAVPAGAIVVHLVAIIEESGEATFDSVIRQGTENILEAAVHGGASHFVYISALGARNDPTLPYMMAKHQAEEAVRLSGLPFTILRPSIVFGEGDGFVNKLAGLVRSFPVVPVAGDGEARFQPVAVEDIAEALGAIVRDPASFSGRILEIGGGEIYTYDEIIGLIRTELGSSKPVVHLPVELVRLVVRLTGWMPKMLRPPVTNEQLNMLRIDNTTLSDDLTGLLGHAPMALRGNLGYLRS
jgi:NADH dehydrogenase